MLILMLFCYCIKSINFVNFLSHPSGVSLSNSDKEPGYDHTRCSVNIYLTFRLSSRQPHSVEVLFLHILKMYILGFELCSVKLVRYVR